MPTIEIETNVDAQAFQRRFAKAVALWAHRRQIAIDHVIVKFRRLAASDVFSGPYPFEVFHRSQNGSAAFAFVTCYVAVDRPQEFRTALAEAIWDAMRPEVPAEYAFIAFRSVDPNDFLYGQTRAHPAPEEVDQ